MPSHHHDTESSKDRIIDLLKNDKRIELAKKLLLEAFEEHKAKLSQIKQSENQRRESYQQALDQLSMIRGFPLFFPYLGSGLGNGVFVELSDGSVKYDMINGIGPQYFGHSHPILVSAAIDAALEDPIMQGNLQQNEDALELSKVLCELSGLPHCFLTTTGVMANENALKIAFNKKYPANRLMAFDRCFMGRTIAASQITDKPLFRQGLPLTIAVDYIPFYNQNDPEGSIKATLKALITHVERYPKQHAAFCLELVQGEGGFYEGDKKFFYEVTTKAKEFGMTIIVDEVQTFARTLQLFAFQHYELQHLVDIITIGKASQICATLFTKENIPGIGLLSQTFIGSTSAIKAAIAEFKMFKAGNFFGTNGRNSEIFKRFQKNFEIIKKKYPEIISGPYGIGAMISFTVFDGSYTKAIEYLQMLFKAGVIGFIAGTNPTRIRFLPAAGVITDEDIDSVCRIIEQTLQMLVKQDMEK